MAACRRSLAVSGSKREIVVFGGLRFNESLIGRVAASAGHGGLALRDSLLCEQLICVDMDRNWIRSGFLIMHLVRLIEMTQDN